MLSGLIVFGGVCLRLFSSVIGADDFGLYLTALLICIVFYLYERRRTHAPFVWRALCQIGIPVCWKCGYPREGLDESANFPECGWNREEATNSE